MTSRPLSGASVHARLRNLAQATGNMNAALPNLQVSYVQQGFLARLAVSPYLDRFVVKGGVTMLARYGDRARPTRDIDLSAQGIDERGAQARDFSHGLAPLARRAAKPKPPVMC